MKTPFHPIPFLTAILLAWPIIHFVHAQQSAVDIKMNPNIAFMITTYNRVFIGTWLEVRGKAEDHAQSVTMRDDPIFAPAEVRVVTKHEPVVVRKDDTWEITFKETKP